MSTSGTGGRRPGMMDVARLAGVSHQTVSRVINVPDSVRPDTRERVQRAIDQLGYRRNMAARALVTDSTRTIGVVTASSHFFGPASTTTAIEDAARAAGYACLVSALRSQDPREVDDLLAFLINRGVDGIIAVAPQVEIARAATKAAGAVPLVLVADGLEPAERIHVVSVDHELGARMAVRHLISQGRTRIAHVSGPADWFDAQARVRGWRAALEDSGLDEAPCLEGDWSAEAGYRLAGALCMREPIDAIFCANDLMALGALAALRDQGIAVPDDVAVVGYDGVDGTAYYTPSLTTVQQPFEDLGRVALEVLVEALRTGGASTSHSISPSLQVRHSSV